MPEHSAKPLLHLAPPANLPGGCRLHGLHGDVIACRGARARAFDAGAG